VAARNTCGLGLESEPSSFRLEGVGATPTARSPDNGVVNVMQPRYRSIDMAI
jgi:hypothetical protein